MKNFLIIFLTFSLLPFSVFASQMEKNIYYANQGDNILFPTPPIFQKCWDLLNPEKNTCFSENNIPFSGILRYEGYDLIVEEEFKKGKLIRQTSDSTIEKMNWLYNEQNELVRIEKFRSQYKEKELCYIINDVPHHKFITLSSTSGYRTIKYENILEGSIDTNINKIKRIEPDIFYANDKKTKLNGKYYWKHSLNLRIVNFKNGILHGNFIQYDNDGEEEFSVEFNNGYAISGYYYQNINGKNHKIKFTDSHLFTFNSSIFYKNPIKPSEKEIDINTLYKLKKLAAQSHINATNINTLGSFYSFELFKGSSNDECHDKFEKITSDYNDEKNTNNPLITE